MRFSFFLFLSLGLMTVGFGCRSNAPPEKIPRATTPASEVYLPPLKAETPRTDADRLRSALANFQQLKSFHADLTIQEEKGETTGRVDVMKPGRFHGWLKMPDQKTPIETIMIDQRIYIRPEGQSWALFRSPKIGEAMRQTFDLSEQTAVTLPDTTSLTHRTDSVKQCEVYEALFRDASELPYTLRACIANELPVYLEITNQGKTSHFEYSNQNKLFTIERPIPMN